MATLGASRALITRSASQSQCASRERGKGRRIGIGATADGVVGVSCSRACGGYRAGVFSVLGARRKWGEVRRGGIRQKEWARGGVPRCGGQTETEEKVPFGYTRKDVILIGVGLLGAGVGLKYGLEFFGVDSARAGNAVQLIMVLGLTVGWISTYVFRVSTKEMTYAKQLKDYENKVMQKRLEELPEAELESMLAQIEEEKRILRENRDKLL